MAATGSAQLGPMAVQNPGQLLSSLKAAAPPPNPTTPLERLNPDQQALEHVKSASVSLERAQQFTNDPLILQALNLMAGTCTKILLKFDGQQVVQFLQEGVQSFPPGVAPGSGGPGAPAPTQQAATAGTPSQTPGAAPNLGGPLA